jgi:hypothetical protein
VQAPVLQKQRRELYGLMGGDRRELPEGLVAVGDELPEFFKRPHALRFGFLLFSLALGLAAQRLGHALEFLRIHPTHLLSWGAF